MPGPYIHIAAADRIADQLSNLRDWGVMPIPDLSGMAPGDLADIVSRKSYYALGAIGPDLFFFLPDFRREADQTISNPLLGIVNWLDNFYDRLDTVLTLLESTFGPLGEDTDEMISRLTGDVSTAIKNVMAELSSILILSLEDIAAESRDWFELFSLGLDRGFDNQDFEWSDMLHYRSPSEFALALWETATRDRARAEDDLKAAGDENAKRTANDEIEWATRKQAYALGYMTHIATDVAGHGFVNEKSGGPFRTHWQRHHLVENHMDADAFSVDHGSQRLYRMLTESALHYRIAFLDDGDNPQALPDYDPDQYARNIQKHYLWRRELDLDSQMPDELAKFIVERLSVYSERLAGADTRTILAHPTDSSPHIIQGGDGRPTPDNLRDTYLILFRYLKYVTTDGFALEKPKPPDVFPNIDWPVFTDPHSLAPGEDDATIDWTHHPVLLIIKIILFLLLLVPLLVTLLIGLFADAATYLPRLLAYYTIELPLYYMIKVERLLLVSTGFTLPMEDEIDPGLMQLGVGTGKAFLAVLHAMDDVLADLGQAGLAAINLDANKLVSELGMTAEDAVAVALAATSTVTAPVEPVNDAAYPHSHEEPTEYLHPWDYPSTPGEQPHTQSGPFAVGDRSTVLLDAKMLGDNDTRKQLEFATDPATTDQVPINGSKNLGDPVNFGLYIIWQLTRDYFPSDSNVSAIVDWNLDADRGYGYKCWDWNRHDAPGPNEPLDQAHHVLKDQDSHDFLEPCTMPPQGGPPTFDSTGSPLLLHYTDEPDPGCSG